jgi:hypothetical protein
LLLIEDTTQRNLRLDPPLKVDQALHYAMCAYKLLPEEATGYKRSKYAWWDIITELG